MAPILLDAVTSFARIDAWQPVTNFRTTSISPRQHALCRGVCVGSCVVWGRSLDFTSPASSTCLISFQQYLSRSSLSPCWCFARAFWRLRIFLPCVLSGVIDCQANRYGFGTFRKSPWPSGRVLLCVCWKPSMMSMGFPSKFGFATA